MLKPFESAKLLVERAAHHLDELETFERVYTSQQPFRHFQERDINGDILFKAALTKLPPGSLSAIAFDAINCLRSALDHAVFDASVRIGGNPQPKFTKFPFGSDYNEALRDFSRKKAEVPEPIRPFILAFEPFKNGREKLWELNELRNSKIHKILSGTIVSATGFGIKGGYIGSLQFDQVSEWDQRDLTLTYMRARVAQNVHIRIDLLVKIAFGVDTPFPNEHAVTILRNFREIMERIVLGIEAESVRLMRLRS